MNIDFIWSKEVLWVQKLRGTVRVQKDSSAKLVVEAMKTLVDVEKAPREEMIIEVR